MNKTLLKVALVALFLLPGASVLATNVGGLICTNTTWNLAGSPYVVTGAIVIGCDATLTIEADVEVKVNLGLGITVGSAAFGGGTLVARGTAGSPIVFTSVKDPCDPCDPAQAGDWTRIYFTDYAVNATFDPGSGAYLSGSILEHVIVEYAGAGNFAAILAEKSSPFLNYCEVRHNWYYGIRVDATSAPRINIVNCEVWDHPQRGIYIRYGSGHRVVDCNIHDNVGGVYLRDAPTNILTGNTITDNTVANYGGGIYFYNCADNTLTGNTLTGNSGRWAGGGIYFAHCSGNTLTENTITGNTTTSSASGGGIEFHNYSGNNTLTGNTITGNTANEYGGGIRFYYYSGGNTLNGNTVSDNTSNSQSGGGICFWDSCGGNTLAGNTVTGNTTAKQGGGIAFDRSGTNTLNGNTVTGNTANQNGGGMYFSSSGSSTLTANTINDNTANQNYGGMCFYSSSNTTLAGNDISGNTALTDVGALYFDNCDNVTLSSNTITDNRVDIGDTGGMYVTAGSEWFSMTGDPCTASYNILWGNDGYAIYNNNSFSADGRHDIDAKYVNWGTCDTGPLQSLIFDYFDDASLAFVVFFPIVKYGDSNMDGAVDWLDLANMCDNWLRSDCGISDWCAGSDLDLTGQVDLFDYAELFRCW